MSILIKGISIPASCKACHEKKLHWQAQCSEWVKVPAANRPYERSKSCPIEEIPDHHGDLVDIDEKVFVERITASGTSVIRKMSVADCLEHYGAEMPHVIADAYYGTGRRVEAAEKTEDTASES